MKLVRGLTLGALAASSMLVMACGNDTQFSEAAAGQEETSSSVENEDVSKPQGTTPELNKRLLSITLFEAYKAPLNPEHPIPVAQVPAAAGDRMGMLRTDILSVTPKKTSVASSKVDFFSWFADCSGSQQVAAKQMDDLLQALSDSPSVKSIDSLTSDPKVNHYRYFEKVSVEQGKATTTYYVALINDKPNKALDDAIDILVKNQQALRAKGICPKIPVPVE